jgi:uncharacterized protein (DUF885 family)
MNKLIQLLTLLLMVFALVMGGCAPKTSQTVAIPSPTALSTEQNTEAPSADVSPGTALPADNSSLVENLQGLDIDAFFDQSYLLLWGRDPETVTILGLSKYFSQNNDQLTDISDAYIRETQTLENDLLALLNQYDRGSLSTDQQLTYDIFKWYLEDRVRSHEFMYDDYPINVTVYSVHASLLSLFTDYQPLEKKEDANAYISRLSQIDQKMTQLVDGLNRRAEAGVVLPQFLLSWVTQEINQIGSSPATGTPYYTTFADKVKNVSGLTDAEKEELLKAAEEAITTSVLPGYQKLVNCLNGQLGQATNDAGVWKFPNGEAYYAYLLRHYTTTTLSADEIHNIGLEQLERIHADMRVIFDQLGYPKDADLPSLYQKVAEDSGMVPGNEMVSMFEGLIADADTRLGDAFDIRPKAKVIVEGADSGGYYMPPAVDGSRPGIFYATLRGSDTKFNMPTLLYHETIPGHHYQIAIAQETDLPPLRRNMDFTGYVEGWALYAERLMSELGVYQDNPYGDLGRLQYEAFRAARLVVDTGIHTKKWDYDKAVEFMVENTGLSRGDMEYEVSRYIAIPAQATAYDIGFIKILELRQKAQDQLGDKFDLKKFHNVILSNGAMPLEVLEQVVDNYIQQELNE